MAESVQCPGCQAHLFLPMLPGGQTVQCPRCKRVFAPAPERAAPKPVPAHADYDEERHGEPERLLPPGPLTGEWKAAFVCILLALCVLSYVLQLGIRYEQIQLLQLENEVAPGGFRLGIGFAPALPGPRLQEFQDRSEHLETTKKFADPVHTLCIIVTLLAFALWVNQTAHNLRLLRANGVKWSPFVAAISIFVPIIQFFQPYQAVQETWRASDPVAVRSPLSWQTAPYSWPIRVWWIGTMAGSAITLLCLLIGEDAWSNDARSTEASLRCLSSVCFGLAAGTLIFVIRGLTARQRERYERLYADEE